MKTKIKHIFLLIIILIFPSPSLNEDYCKKERCSKCEQRDKHIVCTECHERFYLKFNYTCYNCPENCLKCKSSYKCAACGQDYSLNSEEKCSRRKITTELIIGLILGPLGLLLIAWVVCCICRGVVDHKKSREKRRKEMEKRDAEFNNQPANLQYFEFSKPVEIGQNN